MSANDIIVISRKTYEVWHSEIDSPLHKGTPIGVGRNLDEAVDIAMTYIDSLDYHPEHGIYFIGKKI